MPNDGSLHLYDRTAEPRPRLDMVAPTTVPLTFNGCEWSLIVAELRCSPTGYVAELGEQIAQQIKEAVQP